MGILSLIILIILVIVFFLAILGLGWNTFFEGVKKGADKIGITSMTSSAAEIAKNASSGIIGSLLG
jgi:flagellar basal body-associated protein FliL